MKSSKVSETLGGLVEDLTNERTMPQKYIPLEAGQIYHIWTHANGTENLFREPENYRFFLEKYTHYVHPVVETFAYCLMPNHLHLMVRVREKGEVLKFVRDKKNNSTLQGFQTLGGLPKVISRQFSHLFNSYTQSFNKNYDRKGSLFIPNFNRRLVDSDKYFMQLIAYIHNNPVHHGFVENTRDWPYSSWHAYLSEKRTRIKKEEGLRWFGSRKAFQKIHRELQPDNLNVDLLIE